MSRTLERLNRLVDWFIPAAISVDREKRKQARLFLYSHLFGPFIGNTVPLALYLFDPNPGYQIALLAVSISGFWAFPFVLRAFGRYNLLAIVSVQNLIFCILWSCYFYGGVTSPTLPWVLTIPLLAFFYVGPSPTMRAVVLSQFAISLGLFYFLYQTGVHPVSAMPLKAIQGLGLVSTTAASLYVTMMALFYANALASQVELEVEMKEHQVTSSQLRLATEEAERAGAAKSDFLAKMSHELRTPLNAVIGYSEILLEDATDEDDAATVSDLRKIHGAGHYLLKLVNEVLDLSKIDAGRMEVYNEAVECGPLLAKTVVGLNSEAQRNGNELRYSGENLGKVFTDVAKLQQILTQLVDNAAKFTHNGVIRVDADRVHGERGDDIVIRVRDNGEGIARERFSTLFEQFNIAGDTSASKYGGTGLGLALCKKLCELLQGEISVESEINAGACFTVRIPANSGDKAMEGDGEAVSVALAEAEAYHQSLHAIVAGAPAPESDEPAIAIGAAAHA
jgi:signal transduction histidine kinase